MRLERLIHPVSWAIQSNEIFRVQECKNGWTGFSCHLLHFVWTHTFGAGKKEWRKEQMKKKGWEIAPISKGFSTLTSLEKQHRAEDSSNHREILAEREYQAGGGEHPRPQEMHCIWYLEHSAAMLNPVQRCVPDWISKGTLAKGLLSLWANTLVHFGSRMGPLFGNCNYCKHRQRYRGLNTWSMLQPLTEIVLATGTIWDAKLL